MELFVSFCLSFQLNILASLIAGVFPRIPHCKHPAHSCVVDSTASSGQRRHIGIPRLPSPPSYTPNCFMCFICFMLNSTIERPDSPHPFIAIGEERQKSHVAGKSTQKHNRGIGSEIRAASYVFSVIQMWKM